MNGSKDFRAGKELGELKGEIQRLTDAIRNLTNGFNEFRVGTGQRVGELEKGMVEVKGKVSFLLGIFWKMATPLLGFAGIGGVAGVIWYFIVKAK